MRLQQAFCRPPWRFWQPIKRSRRSFINTSDPWSLMDAFLYVEAISIISHSLSFLLDLSRCSSSLSGSRCHLRDTTSFPSSEFHFGNLLGVLDVCNCRQVSFVRKEAAEDCTLPTNSGETLPIPKGTILVAMVDAMHQNRTHKHY